MWTFLGIASFVYVYKKCGDLMSYANKEVLISMLVFFSLGLLLSYRFRSRGLKQQKDKNPQCGLLCNFLATVPFVGFFWTKSHTGPQEDLRPAYRKVGWDLSPTRSQVCFLYLLVYFIGTPPFPPKGTRGYICRSHFLQFIIMTAL